MESIPDGTIASGKNLGLDSDNKVVKSASPSGSIDLTSEVTGTLPVGNGGTGATTLTDNSVLTGTGTSAITAEANLTFTGGTLSIEADANSTADALFIDCNNLESGSAIEIDIDHGTTAAVNAAVSTNIVNIDYDKSADHTSGNRYVRALNVDMNDTATGNSSNYFMYGLDMDLTSANDNGVMGQYGVKTVISGGDTDRMYGIYQKLDDGSVDFMAVSSANVSDYFTIATGANGATTLTTVDNGGDSLANLEIAVDGNITLDAAGDITLDPATGKINKIYDFHGTTFENSYDASDECSGTILKYSANDTNLLGSQIYYLHTDATWVQAHADDVNEGASQLLGVSPGGDPQTVGVLLEGFVRVSTNEIEGTPVVGAPVYVSDITAGHFHFTRPASNNDYVRIVGYCIDTHSSDALIYFKPDNTWVKVTA
jgi:hypothetical protein